MFHSLRETTEAGATRSARDKCAERAFGTGTETVEKKCYFSASAIDVKLCVDLEAYCRRAARRGVIGAYARRWARVSSITRYRLFTTASFSVSPLKRGANECCSGSSEETLARFTLTNRRNVYSGRENAVDSRFDVTPASWSTMQRRAAVLVSPTQPWRSRWRELCCSL